MSNLIHSQLLMMFIFIVFVSNTLPIALAKLCHPTDEEALLDFKRRIMADDKEQLFHTWLKTRDCCTWGGVLCDQNRRVAVINYSDGFGLGHVSGTLSPFLGNLTFLNTLDIDGDPTVGSTNITGPIPVELGKLRNLVELSLTRHQLTGSIPSSLGQLTNLQQLDLSGNNLSGIIPDEIFQPNELSSVKVSHNQLSGPIPSSIGKCISLQALYLDNNRLSGIIPSNIRNLNNLEELVLSYNPFELGEIPIWMQEMKNISWLELAGTGIKGKFPSWIGTMDKLVDLDLSNNGLNSTIPEELGNPKNLTWILLSNNNLTGDIPTKVLDLENLYEFNVSNNRLTGRIPPFKAHLNETLYDFTGNPGLCGSPLPPCKSVV